MCKSVGLLFNVVHDMAFKVVHHIPNQQAIDSKLMNSTVLNSPSSIAGGGSPLPPHLLPNSEEGATPLLQFAYTTWEAVEFAQVAHDTVTSGWWESAYQGSLAQDDTPDEQGSSNIHNKQGEMNLAASTAVGVYRGGGMPLQCSSDIAAQLPASFLQHRQLIGTMGEIVISKLRELAIVLRSDDSPYALAEAETAVLSLVECTLDALMHICEMSTLPLHESRGTNAVAASVCVEAAKGVAEIASELYFLSGSTQHRQAAESQRNQLMAPHVPTLSALMERLVGGLLQHPPATPESESCLIAVASRLERIISAIREVDDGGEMTAGSHSNAEKEEAPRLGYMVIDVAKQAVRLLRSLSQAHRM